MNDQLRSLLTSTIGRWVAAGFALVVAPVLPAVINFVNNVVGYNLSDAQVNSYAQKASLAIAAVIVTWLANRGLFERKALTATSVALPADAASGGFEDDTYDPTGVDKVPADHSKQPAAKKRTTKHAVDDS